MSTPKDSIIRVATVDDLEELALMNQRAFIHSPAQTFLAGVNSPLTTEAKDKRARENQTAFLKFLIRRSWSLNARITVLVLTETDGKEKIVASTIWRPPIEPGHPKAPSTLSALQMGLFSVLRRWGVGVMGRISELIQSSASVLEEGYQERKLSGSPDESWYLQLAGTDPEYQKKGYMAMLLREAFEHTPGVIFTLEATTPASRDVYQHFGFEVVREVVVAKEKVNTGGVVVKETKAATGFPIYPMIKK